MDYTSLSKITYLKHNEISDTIIPNNSVIIFDWDNTLKLYDRKNHIIYLGVTREKLLEWKNDKSCILYIISAIHPSKINMDTLLMELEKLNIKDIFINECDELIIKYNKYVKKGNVIICGYDKAETLMELNTKLNNITNNVIFFDDEYINVINFEKIVKNSKCYNIVQ